MRKRLILLTFAAWIGTVPLTFAAATQVDALIEKLVDKGILTKEEGRELKTEIANDEKLAREEGLKQSLPGWVQNMKWKGDLRLRYQREQRKSTNTRDRGRVRFRLGVESPVNEKVKVAAGVATGNGDPRSTNETLENSFEKSDMRLDYAYAEYMPTEWLTATGGKVPKPFWNPKDLLFDSDIYFDGAAATLKKKFNDTVDGFFNTGFFVLDENNGGSASPVSENSDQFFYGVQPGINVKTSEKTGLKLAAQFYSAGNLKNTSAALAYSSTSNTLVNSKYGYDYDTYGAGSEFTINDPFGVAWVPHLSFFGEYINNPDADEHDTGYLLGWTIGDKKIAGPRQWQLAYNYRRLERNAFLDIFPDSDFYGGKTRVQGHEAIFSYGLAKNISLDLDYYISQPVGSSDTDTKKEQTEHLIQTDLNFKF